MRYIGIVLVLALFTLNSCKKEDIMDKFVPEVLYFKNDRVENADFKETTLAPGISSWTLKARVSAPAKLKEIKLYRDNGGGEALVETYTDFLLSPTVYTINYLVEDISSATVMKIVATDMDGKATARNFNISVSP